MKNEKNQVVLQGNQLPPVPRRGMRRMSNKKVTFRKIKNLKDLEDEDLEMSLYSNFPDREY